jgi:hypothetical protein
MSAEEILRSTEKRALGKNHEIISHVTGKGSQKGGIFKKFSATAFATLMILVLVVFFSSGNLIPAAISERLIEETDVQYADAVESKILVFQQALAQGELPSNTVMRLKSHEVLVGNVRDGVFVEEDNGTTLQMGGKVITADDFVAAVHSDARLYDAFNAATYSRAAYYYDDAAKEVFREIGTSRNNYNSDSDFEDVMNKMVGEGSDIKVNSVARVQKEDKDGNKYYEYVPLSGDVDSEAENFVATVAGKSLGANDTEATLNAASTLNAADTISQDQKSSLFYLAFMENISKMKAGEGDNSKINEAMNYLYDEKTINVVDVETGETITVTGSMLESPSLYAILSGERVKVEAAKNYSSDRVIKTIENRFETTNSGNSISNTVTSTTKGVRGTIGRYITNSSSSASLETLSAVTPIINDSLVNNSFENINGIAAGEMFARGAVNVGSALAKASGSTAGDATAAKSYARLQNTVLAMDAKVDRMNRSPFDITSKNTFLGAIVYNFATLIQKSGPIMRQVANVAQVAKKSIAAILPTTHADDESDSYLTNFGDCETLGTIGAVGSVTCATIETFDTSTLDDPFNDPDFIKFVEENTTLEDGVRKIKSGSRLAEFIIYNNKRTTPDGLVDGGILESLKNGNSSTSFNSDILNMVTTYLGADSREQRIASGAAFVNSDSNTDWDAYDKYSQRYVSLARATAALRQYDGDRTSYTNLKFFEGEESPVVAFLRECKKLANK